MSLKFLLVDDHVLITDCYKMAIMDLGMDVDITAVNSLDSAYDLIAAQKFPNIDLAVLDISMP